MGQEIERLLAAESTLINGDTTRAIILFEEVLKHHPDSYITTLRLAEISYERSIYNEAVQYVNIGEDILFRQLDSLAAKEPLVTEDSLRRKTFREDRSGLLELKGKIRIKQLRYGDAIEAFRAALPYSRQPSNIYQNIGVAYIDQGDKENAIDAFQEAITINPANTAAMMNLGNIYYNEGEYVSASFFYIRALEIDASIVDAYNYLASIRTAQGNYEDAYEFYTAYLDIDESEEIYFKRAVIQAELLNWEASINDWDAVLERNPENADAWRNRGLCFFQLQDFETAAQNFSTAISLQPEPYTFVNRGYCYYLLDRPKEALNDINVGLEQLPEYSLGYYFRGLVYKRMRKKKAACADLNRAMELGMEETEIDRDFLGSCL